MCMMLFMRGPWQNCIRAYKNIWPCLGATVTDVIHGNKLHKTMLLRTFLSSVKVITIIREKIN
jgi:hypothetical protein